MTQHAHNVTRDDANDALIYHNGILDYAAHDAYLRALGYEYLALTCDCGGDNEDGHLPACGWGRLAMVAAYDVAEHTLRVLTHLRISADHLGRGLDLQEMCELATRGARHFGLGDARPCWATKETL